jgi:uroporphyrinogen decarboxylase
LAQIAQFELKRDFLRCGGSSTLLSRSLRIVLELALPVLQGAAEPGIPTHGHSCGSERELVKMAAEVPPMRHRHPAELKHLSGSRIVLKGNLHTTRVMLHGSVDEVEAASLLTLNNAAAGDGFILSTGNQCGKDTPDENIHPIARVARTYGRY